MVVHFFLLFFCKSMQGWIVVTQKSFQVVGGGHCERTEFHGLQVADAFYGYVVGSGHYVVIVTGVS